MKNAPLALVALAMLVAGALAWFLVGTGGVDVPSSAASRDGSEASPASPGGSGSLSDVEAREKAAREAIRVGEASRPRPDAAAASPGRKIPTGPYHGRLVDSLGRPVAGAEVELQTWADASALDTNAFAINMQRKRRVEASAEDGTFSIKRGRSLGRSIGVSATARGFSTDPVKVVLDEADGLDLGDIQLEPAVIVDGWVRDQDDRPVAGARVRRLERDGDAVVDVMDRLGFSGILQLATTDDEGRFELAHEAAGTIELLVEHDDILTQRYEGPSRRAGEVLQDIVIRVERAGKIEGSIVGYPRGRKHGLVAAAAVEHLEAVEDATGMSALLSAQLSPAGDHTADVDENGHFVVSGLVPGARYQVRAISKKMFVQVDSLSEPEEAVAGGEAVALQFDPGATVTFQAIDRATREPIEEITVSGRFGDEPALLQLSPTADRPPTSFPDGKVTLFELRPKAGPRTLTLTIDAAGHFRRRGVEVVVPESGQVDAGKIEFDAAPKLTFHVFDAATGEAVRRARVSLAPARVALSAGDAEEGDGNEVLDEEQQEQREAAEAIMFGEYPERARGKTGRDGRCALTSVSDGAMVLEVKARHFADYIDPAFVAPTGSGKVEIPLQGGGALRVTVRDVHGEPVQDVRVECRTDFGGKVTRTGETTEEDGVALFDHLAAGTHQVRAYRIRRSELVVRRTIEAEWSDAVVVRGVTQEVELEVPAVGDLRGTITLGDGPAVDARVSVVEEERADEVERSIRLQDQLAGLGPSALESDLTDLEGRFELAGIEPGSYAILVRHPDVAMVTRQDVEIDDGVTEVEVEIVMTVLAGRVEDDEGDPVSGARVSVRHHQPGAGTVQGDLAGAFLGSSISAATTDRDGHFRLVGVRAGAPLDVVIQANGYTDRICETVTARERETRTLPVVTLQREGVIEVTFPEGDLAARPRFVAARPVGGRAAETGAAEKIGLVQAGRARLDGLVAGTWEVRSRSRGRRPDDAPEPEPKTVVVEPGEVAHVEF